MNDAADYIFAGSLDEAAIENRGRTKKKKLSKFGQIVIKYINSQSSIAEVIGIDKHKFGRLLYSDTELLAIDLYAVTKFFDLDFNTVIEEICAHIKLNSPEQQTRLRNEYQAGLANAKIKRDKKND